MGGVEDRLVAGQVALAGEHVHGLGARDPRQQFQGEGGHPGLGVGRHVALVREGRKVGDEDGALLHQGELAARRAAVEDGGLYLEHDVGALERRLPVLGDGRAGIAVRGVGERGAVAGALLDNHREAQVLQLPRHVRRNRDPPFAGAALLRYGDFHTVLSTDFPTPTAPGVYARSAAVSQAPRCDKRPAQSLARAEPGPRSGGSGGNRRVAPAARRLFTNATARNR